MFDLSKSVKDFFSGYAQKWDSLYGRENGKNLLSRLTDDILRKVIRVRFEECVSIVTELRCSSILDVGCGSGRYVQEFAQRGLNVVGVDFAEPMLQIAENVIERNGLGQNARLVRASWSEFAQDENFDAVIAIGFFDYQEDPLGALSKMVGVANKVVVASFPKTWGILALQRRIKYRIRQCPLWMYSKKDVEALAFKSTAQGSYSIRDLGRDFLLVIQP